MNVGLISGSIRPEFRVLGRIASEGLSLHSLSTQNVSSKNENISNINSRFNGL